MSWETVSAARFDLQANGLTDFDPPGRMRVGHDASGQVVDLTNCNREPIHIPGRIQPHGLLAVLNGPRLIVEQVSANTDAHLGEPPEAVLGSSIGSWLDADSLERCRQWASDPLREPMAGRLTLGPQGRRQIYDAVVHRHEGLVILETENPRSSDPTSEDQSRSIRRTMSRLQAATDLKELCQVAATEVRALTGFDRVTVYRFDNVWNGSVFAEAKGDDLEPLLGLHFPASDIPEQARRLYHLNRLRLIGDVSAEPVPLVPTANPTTGRPLDLSYSVLRSVSPIHIQYLKNMGAQTSMSISLIRDGRLWGLLSCMNYDQPKYVPPSVREACDILGVLISGQLAVKEDSEGFEYRSRLQAVRERLLQRMSQTPDLVDGLIGEDLLELTGADGAAVVYDGDCAQYGRTPTVEQCKALVAWLKGHTEGEVYHTDRLSQVYPAAEPFKDRASGLMAITTSKSQGRYILWFRPEVVQTVDWGGNPNKPVEAVTPTGELTPRTSFELWKEVVRQRSLPWQVWEVDAAKALRDAIIAVVVRRAEELTRLNAELERSNSDLDAFAFITSHDLKEPLRGINNYATFVMEDYADKLDAEGVAKLTTLVRLSQRMEDIVESILHYSRLGRTDLDFRPTDLNVVIRQCLELLDVMLTENRVNVVIPRPLPTVLCDPVQVALVYSNLITNAIKYRRDTDPRVEIGYNDTAKPSNSTVADPSNSSAVGDCPVLYVLDNGIGIPEKHYQTVFRMFKRLHGRDKFGGGTGAGLAFVKKIIERHGGSIWIESEVGVGSTFSFTLGS